jgi:hypothetical protein
MLGFRERAGFHNFNFVAHARNVIFVVHVAYSSAPNVLAVPRMFDQARDLDSTGLVHLVTGHDALNHASSAPFLVSHG